MILVLLIAVLAYTSMALIPAAPGVPGAGEAGAQTGPSLPPGFPESCGLDFLLILDESGSIESAGAVDEVQDAFGTLVGSLMGTGSRLA
ncbi:MAG: hypothetical protein EHM57_08575, partial [Actinobacteria bacterium]